MLAPPFSCNKLNAAERSFNPNAERQSPNRFSEGCTLASESFGESLNSIPTVTQSSHSYSSSLPISLCSYHSQHHMLNNAHQVDSFVMRCIQKNNDQDEDSCALSDKENIAVPEEMHIHDKKRISSLDLDLRHEESGNACSSPRHVSRNQSFYDSNLDQLPSEIYTQNYPKVLFPPENDGQNELRTENFNQPSNTTHSTSTFLQDINLNSDEQTQIDANKLSSIQGPLTKSQVKDSFNSIVINKTSEQIFTNKERNANALSSGNTNILIANELNGSIKKNHIPVYNDSRILNSWIERIKYNTFVAENNAKIMKSAIENLTLGFNPTAPCYNHTSACLKSKGIDKEMKCSGVTDTICVDCTRNKNYSYKNLQFFSFVDVNFDKTVQDADVSFEQNILQSHDELLSLESDSNLSICSGDISFQSESHRVLDSKFSKVRSDLSVDSYSTVKDKESIVQDKQISHQLDQLHSLESDSNLSICSDDILSQSGSQRVPDSKFFNVRSDLSVDSYSTVKDFDNETSFESDCSDHFDDDDDLSMESEIENSFEPQSMNLNVAQTPVSTCSSAHFQDDSNLGLTSVEKQILPPTSLDIDYTATNSQFLVDQARVITSLIEPWCQNMKNIVSNFSKEKAIPHDDEVNDCPEWLNRNNSINATVTLLKDERKKTKRKWRIIYTLVLFSLVLFNFLVASSTILKWYYGQTNTIDIEKAGIPIFFKSDHMNCQSNEQL